MSSPRVIVWDAQGRPYAIPADTDFMPVVWMVNYVPPATVVVEQPVQENGPNEEDYSAVEAARVNQEAFNRAKEIIAVFDGDDDGEEPCPCETKIVAALRKGVAEEDFEGIKEAVEEWDALQDRNDEQQDDKDRAEENALRIEVAKLFGDANHAFHTQQKCYKERAPYAEQHAAWVAYVKTCDMLREKMREYNTAHGPVYGSLTMEIMANERWPGKESEHKGFDAKIDDIYNKIKSKISTKPKRGGAPPPATLDQLVMPHVRGAEKAAGGGKPPV